MIRAERGWRRLTFSQTTMSPLFTDTGCDPSSPGSLSAEESRSNTGGSERDRDRDGDGQQDLDRGTTRQEKNRDAARKSRKKQTERADELHEELQSLEQSNSALQKEIALLKKELQHYTSVLERHEPSCRLRASTSISTTHLSAPLSANRSSPPRAFSSTQASTVSISSSLTSSQGLQTLHRQKSTCPSISAFGSLTGSSAGHFASPAPISSSSIVAPPHSLFSQDPPTFITSRPRIPAVPVCASFVSTPAPSISAAQSGLGSYSVSANKYPPTPFSAPPDVSEQKQASFLASAVLPYSQVVSQNTSPEVQGYAVPRPQLLPGYLRGNPINQSPSSSLLPSPIQGPALQSLPDTANPTSFLSCLTVPSPLDPSQATSSSFDVALSEVPTLLATLGEPLSDLSLSELLEVNDWILQ